MRASLPNGEEVVEWRCEDDCEVGIAALALSINIASTLNVPRKSLRMVWNTPTGMPPISSSEAGTPQWKVIVDGALSQLEPGSHNNGGVAAGSPVCFCCADPCGDASDNDALRSPSENCRRCHPDSLCQACHVQLPRRGWECFDCLYPEEQRSLDRRTERRFRLVHPGLYDLS